MLTDASLGKVEEFVARKVEQWERVSKKWPSLGMVRSGERGTQFMLIWSTNEIYEGVIFGQLAHKAPRAQGRRRAAADMPNEKKPVERRGIDLTDAQIDQVVKCWQNNKSALSLDFVPGVWGQDGRMRIA